MKAIANNIRVGNIIEFEGNLWRVTKKMHTQPGKGGAYIQAELKDIQRGTKRNERFRSEESVEIARLDQRDFQYLFSDGQQATLMDQESFEQIAVDLELFGEQAPYLQDGMMVKVESYNDNIVGATVAATVVLEVMETEAVVKGQTAASSYKPAIMDNGVRVMVPPFINVGDKLVVNTEDSSYVERAK